MHYIVRQGFVLSYYKLQPWSKHLGTLEEIRHKDALC